MKGIIFDLDGVICFTDRYHYRAWKELADRLQIPFDEEDNNRLRGVSRMESLRIILERSRVAYTEAEQAAFAAEKNARYRALLADMTPEDVSMEVMSALKELRRRGYRLAIGSSSKNAPFILERIGLSDFFDAVSDGNNITHSKPHPEVFLAAAHMLNLPPEECLVVEDAHAGVEAAVAAGMQCASLGDARDNPQSSYHLFAFKDLLTVCP